MSEPPSVKRALDLADRAQAICDAQHGVGDRCCLMREVADFLREVAAAAAGPKLPPIFTITGTIVDMGELEQGCGLAISKGGRRTTVLGLSRDDVRTMRMAFAEEVTLTVRPTK